MEAIGIATPLVRAGDDLVEIFWQACRAAGQSIRNGGIVIVTSKVAAVAAGRLAPCANPADLDALVAAESDHVWGRIAEGFALTKKDGFVMPNAGIDLSNAPPGQAVLFPRDMQQFVDDFRQRLKQKARAESLGVILADSRVAPFRLGISGVALAWSGLLGVSDERGKSDLFGKPLKVSRLAIADNLASLAQLFFGQAAEQTPFVLINDAPVAFSDTQQDYKSAQIDPADDLYAPLFRA